MRKRPMTYRDYFCQECGLRLTVPRPVGRLRGEGHVKHMYCVSCGKTRGFVEMNTQTFEKPPICHGERF